MSTIARQAQGLIEGYQPGEFSTSRSAVIERLLSGEPSTEISPERTEKWFKGAVAQPMMSAFEEYIRPQLQRAFLSSGALRSSRKGTAEADVLKGMSTEMTKQLTTAQREDEMLRAQLRESALARALQAVPISQQAAMQPLMEASGMLQAEDPLYQRELMDYQAPYLEWVRSMGADPIAQLGLGLTGQSHLYAAPSYSPDYLGGAVGMGAGFLEGGGLDMLSGLFNKDKTTGKTTGSVGGGTGSTIGSVLGSLIGTAVGGPAGTVVGGQIGSTAGSYFN